MEIKKYLVIELFPFPNLVTDEEGNVKEFTNYKQARIECNQLQEGIVVDIAECKRNNLINKIFD